jgi:hypothetical protein
MNEEAADVCWHSVLCVLYQHSLRSVDSGRRRVWLNVPPAATGALPLTSFSAGKPANCEAFGESAQTTRPAGCRLMLSLSPLLQGITSSAIPCSVIYRVMPGSHWTGAI